MRKKYFWLLEILIWFILLVGLITVGINFGKDYLNSQKTYNVTFKDVDGLIVGSPVRIMGIQVGHVTRTDLLDGKVNIMFVITNNDVNIPAGSTINIQFTGLAGSKSLEIQPPESPNKGELFNVQEPIRIDSILKVQSDITKSILDCSKLALSFLGHNGVEEIKKNIKHSRVVTKDIDNTLYNTAGFMRNTRIEMMADSKDIQKYLNNGTEFFDYVNNEEFKSPEDEKRSIVSMLNDMHNTSKLFESGKVDSYADHAAYNIKVFNHKVSKINTNVRAKKSTFWDGVYNSLNKFSSGCSTVSSFIQKDFDHRDALNTHSNIKKQTSGTSAKL